MADIAAVFHWTPPVLYAMTFEELHTWHRLAVDRYKLMQENLARMLSPSQKR